MTCYHCKRNIKSNENRIYVPYYRSGRRLKRTWCIKCGNDDAIVESGIPGQVARYRGYTRENARGQDVKLPMSVMTED